MEGRSHATYAEIDRRANAVAHLLLEQGIQRGDRVGLLAANSSEYIAAYYGILKAGAVVVSLNASADGDSCRELLSCARHAAWSAAAAWARRAGGCRTACAISNSWSVGQRNGRSGLRKSMECRFVDQVAARCG